MMTYKDKMGKFLRNRWSSNILRSLWSKLAKSLVTSRFALRMSITHTQPKKKACFQDNVAYQILPPGEEKYCRRKIQRGNTQVFWLAENEEFERDIRYTAEDGHNE